MVQGPFEHLSRNVQREQCHHRGNHEHDRVGLQCLLQEHTRRNRHNQQDWDDEDEDIDFAPLGMPKESDWILYGAYNFDHTHMRNPLIYELSRQMGRYAARTQFVEVFLNENGGTLSSADYWGVYSFMENIK